MANSRPLVDGYLERISVAGLEKYPEDITELIGNQHGVYALYKKDRLYYVGLAVDLRRRIKQHLKDRHAGKWDRFSLYLVRKVDHIKEIESLLLRIANPRGNTHGGNLGQATNLKRQLNQLVTQRQKRERDTVLGSVKRRSTGETRQPRSKMIAKSKDKRESDRPLKGMFPGGKMLYANYKKKEYKAFVFASGRIKLDGQFFDSPSSAARAICNRASNGWNFWRVKQDNILVKLSQLRMRNKKAK